MNAGVDSEHDPRLLSSREFLRELVLLSCCSWQLSAVLTCPLVGRVQVWAQMLEWTVSRTPGCCLPGSS